MQYGPRQSIRKNRLFVFILILMLFVAGKTTAEISADRLFLDGKRYYTNADYDSAVDAFKKAVDLRPDSSLYHYWLGKSYGRLAENSGIFSAYQLSNLTREEFELAVELDGTHRNALVDLMEFYKRAPGFLGGGQDKAEAIRIRLDALDQGMETAKSP
jgi:tetratricopeptide (TPR) repeat protein